MDFVTVGNANNAADTTRGGLVPTGSVAYTYNLGMYEVSREQIDKANSAGGLGLTMMDMTRQGGNGANRPATGVTWFEVAKYVNWLNTSRGLPAAYKFVSGTFQRWSAADAGYNANNLFRNSLAKYVIPSTDEWYKGAYGNLNGTWNVYPTGSNVAPTEVTEGTDANTAVYGYLRGYGGYGSPADINNAGGLSPYGTMAQGGNVWELMESAYDATNATDGEIREFRGGSWYSRGNDLLSLNYSGIAADNQDFDSVGFRIAMIPEPSSLSLLLIGVAGMASRRLLKQRG